MTQLFSTLSLPKLTKRFNTILIKNPSKLFNRNWQDEFKICIGIKRTYIGKTILKKQKIFGGVIPPNFKIHCTTTQSRQYDTVVKTGI